MIATSGKPFIKKKNTSSEEYVTAATNISGTEAALSHSLQDILLQNLVVKCSS